jgi:Aspartokinases
MNIIETVVNTEDISLVTLNNIPSDISFISDIFSQVADKNINVDIISQSAPMGDLCNLSFTLPDKDLKKVFDIIKNIRTNNPDIKSIISSSNCKITVYGEKMRTEAGIAAKVFKIAADLMADVCIINTSETDISILVSNIDAENIVQKIKEMNL